MAVTVGRHDNSIGISTNGNTAGSTGFVHGRYMLVGGANVTLSQSTNASGYATLSIVGGGGVGGGIALQAGTQTATSGTVIFSNSNGVTFGMSDNSVVTASVGGVAAGSFSAGTTRVALGEVVFSNSNGLTFGLDGSTVTGSYTVPTQSNQTLGLYASSQTTGQSSSSTVNATALTLRGMGAATVGLSGGEVIISAPTNYLTTAALSNHSHGNPTLALTNLSGTTASNSNGLTLSLSAAAGGPGGGAATISMWPLQGEVGWATNSVMFGGVSGSTGGSTQFTASGRIYSIPFPHQLEFAEINMLVAAVTNAGTGSATNGQMLGFYTLNNNSALSLHTSYHWGHVISQNSATAHTRIMWAGTNSAANTTTTQGNVSASFTGVRAIQLNDAAGTLSAHPGGYYVGVMVTQRSTNVNVWAINTYGYFTGSQTSGASKMGASTYDGDGFQGIFSTTTNTNVIIGGIYLPSSIHTSAITRSATSQLLEPYFYAFRKTT